MPAIRQLSPNDGEVCFDLGNPFDVQHRGKLRLGAPGPASKPVGHCVAESISGEFSLVRFTALHPEDVASDFPYLRCIGFFEHADQAAEVHKRHIKKIGECGITPWIAQLEPGQCSSLNNAEGIFLQQPLLPETAIPISDETTPEAADAYINAIVKYMAWAEDEDVYLWDIDSLLQGNILEDELVLRDIEPLYAPSTIIRYKS